MYMTLHHDLPRSLKKKKNLVKDNQTPPLLQKKNDKGPTSKWLTMRGTYLIGTSCWCKEFEKLVCIWWSMHDHMLHLRPPGSPFLKHDTLFSLDMKTRLRTFIADTVSNTYRLYEYFFLSKSMIKWVGHFQ